jgi:hypothetical protein
MAMVFKVITSDDIDYSEGKINNIEGIIRPSISTVVPSVIRLLLTYSLAIFLAFSGSIALASSGEKEVVKAQLREAKKSTVITPIMMYSFFCFIFLCY